MKAKTVIGIAVASALSWSYGAMADSRMDRISGSGTFEVMTPFSPNEAGPAELAPVRTASSMEVAASEHDLMTPLASREAGPSDIRLQRRGQTFHTARASRSMPNPQTPWSPNEAGLNTFAEDMRDHALHVAEVERAHIAAAEWNAHLASAASTAVEPREGTAQLTEPVGSTSGIALQGSSERIVDPNQPSSLIEPPTEPEVRGDAAGLPAEVERTSAIRPEGEYPLPVTQYNTVGILETPRAPSELTVWSVEPLTPQADLTTGDTVYLVPENADIVFAPDFGDSSPLGATGERSASMSDDAGETSSSSL